MVRSRHRSRSGNETVRESSSLHPSNSIQSQEMNFGGRKVNQPNYVTRRVHSFLSSAHLTQSVSVSMLSIQIQQEMYDVPILVVCRDISLYIISHNLLAC